MAIKKVLGLPDVNYIVLGADEYYSKDGKETRCNNNVIIFGRSGSGKTRSFVEPNMMACEGSYVISDPKGQLYKKYAQYYRDRGYEVIYVDFVHPRTSSRYNPFRKIRNKADIRALASVFVYDMEKGHMTQDPFWDDMAMAFLEALISYMVESGDIAEEEQNMSMLISLAGMAKRDAHTFPLNCRPDSDSSQFDRLLKDYDERMGEKTWASTQFDLVNISPEKTYNTIIATVNSKLAKCSDEDLLVMLSGDDISFTEIGCRPTAVFVGVSDTDRSCDAIINLFYSQLMNRLCSYADEECPGGALPVPVQFILDDFATNCRIENFDNIISNIRSRNISAMLMVQSIAQLKKGYGESAITILDGCSSMLYLGGMSRETAEEIAVRCNKPLKKILEMPVDTGYLFRIGQAPRMVDFVDLEDFQQRKGYTRSAKEKASSVECSGRDAEH